MSGRSQEKNQKLPNSSRAIGCSAPRPNYLLVYKRPPRPTTYFCRLWISDLPTGQQIVFPSSGAAVFSDDLGVAFKMSHAEKRRPSASGPGPAPLCASQTGTREVKNSLHPSRRLITAIVGKIPPLISGGICAQGASLWESKADEFKATRYFSCRAARFSLKKGSSVQRDTRKRRETNAGEQPRRLRVSSCLAPLVHHRTDAQLFPCLKGSRESLDRC